MEHVRPSMGAKNQNQLYNSINHHRTTTNLWDIVWFLSGGVWSMSGGVWWCLVVFDGVWSMSNGVFIG